MAEIDAETKTVRELFGKGKYKIDYYQREYQWGESHIAKLISDLVDKFDDNYEEVHNWSDVKGYSSYFLGSIIISKKEGDNYIVDGQQRLTSLTLLIIFLNNLQKDSKSEIQPEEQILLDELILSASFGIRSFNLDIEGRMPCMQALYDGELSDADSFVKNYAKGKEEQASVRNLYECYQNISDYFPENLQRGQVLLYFIEWLINRVELVSMKTRSDKDAYTIFETMNDRGLSLSPTDMLKSFLLVNIDEEEREGVNNLWKKQIRELNILGKNAVSDFFKSWLRSQYAKDWKNFDLIGSEFHRWVDRKGNGIGLKKDDKNSYLKFSTTDFKFYSEQYLRLARASKLEALGTPAAAGLEHVCYNALNGFTLQYMLLLAPLGLEDTPEEITKKIKITVRYIDILLTLRLWNSRNIGQSWIKVDVFRVMQKIREYRDGSSSELAEFLFADLERVQRDEISFSQAEVLYFKGKRLHRMLARITDFVEVKSGEHSRFKEFMGKEKGDDGKMINWEVEHILPYKYFDDHKDNFYAYEEFEKCRSQLGGLLLLPKSLNASLKDKPYKSKLKHYYGKGKNILAKSLHPDCYENHPKFNGFLARTDLQFKSIEDFEKEDIRKRGELYREIAKLVWNPEDLLEVAKDPQV